MTANTDIDVTANSSGTHEGDITFTSTINDDNSGTAATLTLDADGGAISIGGAIGANHAVGALNINQDAADHHGNITLKGCLLYTSPSPRDPHLSRMPSSA